MQYLLKQTLLAMVCLACSANAFAATFQCSVDVDTVLIYKDGNVNVRHSGRGDYTVVCNLSSARQGVSTTTCAMWAAVLLKAEANKRKTHFWFTTDTASSCADLPTYSSAPAPIYIGWID